MGSPFRCASVPYSEMTATAEIMPNRHRRASALGRALAITTLAIAAQSTAAHAWGLGSMIEHAAVYAAGGVAAHETDRYLDHRSWHHTWHRSTQPSAAATNTGGNAETAAPAGALPNPSLTPGAIDPRVTQANIDQTICRPGGYTRSVRPPESYTERLKRAQIRQYGYADRRMGDYEEDHLVELAVGGAPSDPRNLWPQPHQAAGGWGSYAKDRLELRLHDLVCARRVSLAAAQSALATNWIAAYKRYVGPAPQNTPMRWMR